MALKTTLLGDTGLRVTRLGLGLAALGRPGYINLGHGEDLAFNYVVEAMERRTHRMLDLAYRKGIRYFDVARSYGRAEQFLRSWLETNRPDDVVVASKWGYTYTADWKVEADVHEIKDHSLENLERQWALSRELLPYLKIYQIHSATLESGVLDKSDVLERLARLREEEGVLIGLSVSGSRQTDVLRQALERAVDGRRVFDVVQATFNILEQSTAPVLEEAAARGLGVVVKEALANGRLTVRNNNPDFAGRKQQLELIAREYEAEMDAVALAFVLAQPWAQVVLSGAVIENHLESNARAPHLDLGRNALQLIAAMRMEREAYWEQREKLTWN